MGLLGDSWSDPQSQMIMGLAQGLLSAQGGQGLAAGLGNMHGVQQNQMKNKLVNAQLENYQSEIEARKLAGVKDARQQALIASMFGGGGQPEQQPSGAGSSMTSDAGAQSTYGGAPGAQPQGAANLVQLAKQYGIPEQAIQSDMVFNGGKGIADMLFKRGAPDMQVTNGYAYDKNKQGAGYLPFLQTSASGQTSMGQVGADGLPVVSAPQGAVDTYNAYQNATNKSAANNKTQKVYNPVTQREEYTTEGAIIDAARQQQRLPAATAPQGPAGYANEPQMKVTASGDMGADPKALAREIATTSRDVMNPNLDAPSRQLLKTYLDDLRGQQARLGSLPAQPMQAPQAQGGGFAAGPSANEAAGVKFKDKMATNQADVLDKSYTTASDAATNLKGIYESRQAMNSGAFQGAGADLKLAVSKFGASIGIPLDAAKATNTDYLKSTLGNGLLEKAKTLGSNPSNADASRITDIVGSIGKDPDAMRKILDWQESMSNRSITLHNSKVDQAEKNGFKGQFDMRVTAPTVDKPVATATRNSGASGSWEPSGKASAMSSGGWSATLKK